MISRWRSVGRWGLIYGGYLLLAIAMTYPLITRLNTHFIGAPESDAYEYARHIWWYTYALQNGEPVFHHTYLAHPDGLPALWLWAIPLQSFPAVIFSWVMPLPIAYNLMVLLRLALNGWAMAFLVRRLVDGTHTEQPLTLYAGAVALVAGAMFLLWPAVQGQLFGSHAGIVALWGGPLYIDALYRLRRHQRPRDYLLAGLLFVAVILGSSLSLLFIALPLSALMWVTALAQRDWRWLRSVSIATVIGLVFAAVFFVPAAYEQATSPAAVDPGGAVRFSADALAVVTPSFFHPLFAALDYPRRVLGTNIVEGTAYVGVVAVLLVVVAGVRVPRARGWLAFTLICWVLSLGPLLKLLDAPVTISVDGQATYIPLPFALVAYLPVIDTIRTPGRFNLTMGIAVAIMAGYGLAWLTARLRAKRRGLVWALSAALIAVIAFEYQLVWQNRLPNFPTVTAHIPDEIRALRDDPDVRAVFNVPHDNLLVAKEAMYLQTGHQKPLVAGFISRETPVSPAKRQLMQATLNPALLDAADADVVILFKGWDDALNAHVVEQLGPPFYTDERIAAFRVPEPDAPPAFHADVSVPEQVTMPAPMYIYSPEPGWLLLTGQLSGDGRDIAWTLDRQVIGRATVGPGADLRWPVPLQFGYTTLQLEPQPPCPPTTPANSRCRPVTVDALSHGDPVKPALDNAVTFADGIRLNSAAIVPNAAANTLDVWLWWHFADGITAEQVRFVHLIDPNGNQVAGADRPLGKVTAGEGRAEAVTLQLPDDLGAGRYAVYAGWYTFPDLARSDVLSDVPGAANDWVLLGEVNLGG